MRVIWNTDGSTVIVFTAEEKDEALMAAELLLQLYKEEGDTSEAKAVIEKMRGGIIIH